MKRQLLFAIACAAQIASAGEWYEDELTAGFTPVSPDRAIIPARKATGRFVLGGMAENGIDRGYNYDMWYFKASDLAGKTLMFAFKPTGEGWITVKQEGFTPYDGTHHNGGQVLPYREMPVRYFFGPFPTNHTADIGIFVQVDGHAEFDPPVCLAKEGAITLAATNPHLSDGGSLPEGYVESRHPALPEGEIDLTRGAESYSLDLLPSRLAMATDGSLGTLERKPFVVKFPKAVTATGFRWTLPQRTMEVYADTDGDGQFETDVYRQWNGPAFSTWANLPEYVWFIHRFAEPLTAHAFLVVGGSYEFELTGPKEMAARTGCEPYQNGRACRPATAALAVGATLAEQPAPPSDADRLWYGFCLEPWMFGVQNRMIDFYNKGTPVGEVSDWSEWQSIAQDFHELHANFVLLFPPNTFWMPPGVTPRAGSSYPYPLLWPSDVWYCNQTNDLLTSFNAACHKEGFKNFVIPRGWDFKTNETEEVKQVTLAKEIAERGSDGIPMCVDEQYFYMPINFTQQGAEGDKLRADFFAWSNQSNLPHQAFYEDTLATRLGYLYSVKLKTDWMAQIKEKQLQYAPNALTFGGFAGTDYWQIRHQYVSAADYWGWEGKCDVVGGDGTYFGVGGESSGQNFCSLTPALATCSHLACTPKRLSMATVNFNWGMQWDATNKKMTNPLVYDDFPNIAHTAGALATYFNKGTHLDYWRYNFMDMKGPETRAAVKAGGYMTEVLGAWGGKAAEVPKDVLVLRSRTSEDWWSLKCLYNYSAFPVGTANTRYSRWGHHLYFWTLVRLAERATPFEVYALHRPDAWKDIAANYKVIVLPFSYAVADAEAAALKAAADAGVKILVLGGDEAGTVDGLGEKRATNAFDGIGVERFTIANAMVPATKQLALDFDAKMRELLPEPSLAIDRADGYDVQAFMLSAGPREKLVMVANWSERATSVNIHLALPSDSYQMEVCGTNAVSTGTIGGKTVFSAEDAASFRVDLEREGVRMFRIRTAGTAAEPTVIPWSDGEKGGSLSFGAEASGDSLLTLPQRDYTTQVKDLSFYAGSNGTLTVDGGTAGYSFGMATNYQEYAYATTPFAINGPDGSLFDVYRVTRSGVTPASDSAPQIEITNAAFRVIRDGTTSALHIDGGVWNAGAPYGVANGNTVRIANGYGDNQLENLICVHEGASLDLPYLCYNAKARDRDLLCFDGGHHRIRQRLCFPGDNLPSAYAGIDRTVEMILTGADTVLDVDGTFSPLSCQHGNGEAGNHENTDVQVIVRDGAQLTVAGHLYPINKAKRFLLNVASGGRVHVKGVAYLAQNSALPCTVLVEDGGFYQGDSEVWLGNQTACSFAVTNAAASFGNFRMWNGSILACENASITNSNVWGVLFHANLKGGNWYVNSTSGINLYSTSTAFIDDCDVWSYGNVCIGCSEGPLASAVFTNSATAYVKTGFKIGSADSSAGRLDIVDRSVATAWYYPLEIGLGTGSSGTVNLRSGSVFLHESGAAGATRTLVGANGDGTLVIDDASFTNHISHVIVANAATSVGTLVMTNGAFMRANHLIGGSGTSSLLANGATFMPNGTANGASVSSDLISGLSSAKLGAAGLTVDSPYDVTVSQAFANDGSADGLLVLAGAGKKTLTGASTHAVTRIAEGSGVVPTGVSRVEVAQGATLSLANGAADAVTYGGLVVGDADGAGILAVDAADTITVTAAPVFNGVYLALNGTPANGTYPLVKTCAEVASATQTGWAAGYIYSGRQDGKMYSFTVSETDGVTSFNLVVADARDLDPSLVKNYNGAGGAVAVDGVEAVDAIAFDSAGGYAVGGTGAFSLNDTGSGYVRALTGVHELGIGLILPGVTVFDVAEGAELEVSGDIRNGAVTKTGFGKLTLAGTNSFLDTLTLEKGTVRIEGAAAAGYNGAALSNDLLLKRGTVEFEGDAEGETLGRPLVVEAGAKTAVVANVKTPLTVTSLNQKSGTFIKRGAGTLTYDLSADTKITCESGINWYGGVGNLVTFPSTGDMPSGCPIEGYNIAEGAVVVKGAADRYAYMQNYWRLGLNTAEGTVDPSFTVDGLRVNAVSGQLQMGLVSKDAFARHFSFTLRNGGRYGTDGIYVGGIDDEDGRGSSVCDLTIGDGGWLAVSWALNMSQHAYAKVNVNQSNGGSLYVPGFGFQSPFTWTVSGGRFGNCGDRCPTENATSVVFGYYSKGTATLMNADFRCSGNFTRQSLPNYNAIYSTNAIAFHFDGTTWYPKASDVDLAIREAETFTLDVTGNGLVISNDAATTFATKKAFTGDGKIVKAGAGTLVFGENATVKGATFPSQSKDETIHVLDRTYTMDVTGGLEIREGVVVVSNGTIRTDSVVTIAEGAVLDLSGSTVEVEAIGGRGTVRNGTLKAKRILADGTNLQFVNATLACDGRLKLDFGRDATDPLDYKAISPLAIATFTGVEQSALHVKVVNSGVSRLGGTATVEDGVLKVTLAPRGLTVIVR